MADDNALHGEYDTRLARIEDALGNDERGLVKDIREIKEILSQARGILVVVKVGAFLLGIGASMAIIYGELLKKIH